MPITRMNRVWQRGPTEPTQPILQPPLCNCHGTAFGRLFVVSIEYVCFHLCFWHFFLIEKENFICYSSTKTHNLCMWLWVIEYGAGAGIWPIEKRKCLKKEKEIPMCRLLNVLQSQPFSSSWNSSFTNK